ncbi:hypothetical protein [Longimicrobium sp.]|uniref:hypothetical protein n=1 Tax=Longimicrobium sp. TaxID=2029185 RepID=UPI002E336178|nr:hypothetical protein [Longimicrobium sp.]HEX6038871.1 hypothetical protein [Longimicrobium sp.]
MTSVAVTNPLRGICAHCGYTYRGGAEPASHGICKFCLPIIKELGMTGAAIEACRRHAETQVGRLERQIMEGLALRPARKDLTEAEVFAGLMEQGQ